MNSYNKAGHGHHEYKPGDFAVRFIDCAKPTPAGCEAEAQRFSRQWRLAFQNP
jgi:hypothetical protein